MDLKYCRPIFSLFIIGTLSACASPKATMLRYETAMMAQFSADSPEEAEKVTLDSANEHCTKISSSVIVIRKEDFYKGKLDEMLNKSLQGVRILTPFFMKTVVDVFIEETPYTSRLTFRCEA